MAGKRALFVLLLLFATPLYAQRGIWEDGLSRGNADTVYCQLAGGTGCVLAGQLRVTDGTAGTPSIARSGATGHGFYFGATYFGYGTTSANAARFDLTGVSAERTYTFPNANSSFPIATQTITWTGPTAARTYTLADSAVTIADLTTAQTITGKTIGRFSTTGSAPTPTLQTATFGTTPSVAMATGSSDSAGAINITMGSAPANATGTVRLAFSSAFGTNTPACIWTLQNNTGTFNARATVIVDGLNSGNTQSQVLLDNNAVNWTASVIYQLSYHCTGK